MPHYRTKQNKNIATSWILRGVALHASQPQVIPIIHILLHVCFFDHQGLNGLVLRKTFSWMISSFDQNWTTRHSIPLGTRDLPPQRPSTVSLPPAPKALGHVDAQDLPKVAEGRLDWSTGDVRPTGSADSDRRKLPKVRIPLVKSSYAHEMGQHSRTAEWPQTKPVM